MLHNTLEWHVSVQMNVTRIWFAGYINDGTASGINALRRLKVKRCGELALRLSSRLTFAYLCVVVRAIHLTVNMPLRIRVGVHRGFPLTHFSTQI